MITILVDHDIEGQAMRILATYVAQGWQDIIPLRMVMLAEVDYAWKAVTVWYGALFKHRG